MTKHYYIPVLTAALFALSSCGAVKKIPVAKTGVQLLDGTWKLETTNDNDALKGSTIAVYAETADGLITTLQNNVYCVRPTDVIWKDIESNKNGEYSINALSSSCISSLVYKPAKLTLVSSDEIRLSGQTAGCAELQQTWKRVLIVKQ